MSHFDDPFPPLTCDVIYGGPSSGNFVYYEQISYVKKLLQKHANGAGDRVWRHTLSIRHNSLQVAIILHVRYSGIIKLKNTEIKSSNYATK